MRVKGREHALDSALNELLILNIAHVITLNHRENIGEHLELFEEIRTGALLCGDTGKLTTGEHERNTEEDAHTSENFFTSRKTGTHPLS